MKIIIFTQHNYLSNLCFLNAQRLLPKRPNQSFFCNYSNSDRFLDQMILHISSVFEYHIKRYIHFINYYYYYPIILNAFCGACQIMERSGRRCHGDDQASPGAKYGLPEPKSVFSSLRCGFISMHFHFSTLNYFKGK